MVEKLNLNQEESQADNSSKLVLPEQYGESKFVEPKQDAKEVAERAEESRRKNEEQKVKDEAKKREEQQMILEEKEGKALPQEKKETVMDGTPVIGETEAKAFTQETEVTKTRLLSREQRDRLRAGAPYTTIEELGKKAEGAKKDKNAPASKLVLPEQYEEPKFVEPKQDAKEVAEKMEENQRKKEEQRIKDEAKKREEEQMRLNEKTEKAMPQEKREFQEGPVEIGTLEKEKTEISEGKTEETEVKNLESEVAHKELKETFEPLFEFDDAVDAEAKKPLYDHYLTNDGGPGLKVIDKEQWEKEGSRPDMVGFGTKMVYGQYYYNNEGKPATREEWIKIKEAEFADGKIESQFLSKKTAELFRQATGEDLKPKIREVAVKKAEAKGHKIIKTSEFLASSTAKMQEKVRGETREGSINGRWQNVLTEKERAKYGDVEKYKKALDAQRQGLEKKGISIPEDVFYGLVGEKDININGIGKGWFGGIKIPGLKQEDGKNQKAFSKKEFNEWAQNLQGQWSKYIDSESSERLNRIVTKAKERWKGSKQEAAKEIVRETVLNHDIESRKKRAEVSQKKEAEKKPKESELLKSVEAFTPRQVTKLIKEAGRGLDSAKADIKRMKEALAGLTKKGKVSLKESVWLNKMWAEYFA